MPSGARHFTGSSKRVEAHPKSSNLVVNSVALSRDLPVFTGFFEIIRVVLTKTQDKKKKTSSIKLILRTIGLWGGLLIFLIALILDVTTHGNTSMLHVGAGIIMIVGAFMIGRESKNLLEVGIGIACGILSMLLGLVLQEGFHGNGSMMEIAGGLVIVISIIRLVQITKNK